MSIDWDDAYTNGAYIEGAAGYPADWAAQAAQFRAGARSELDIPYGEGAREQLDLFFPADKPKGLLVFVHGGYWLSFDKSVWSHLAAGGIERGWAVALPSYPLAPAARIRDMTVCVAAAIELAASRVAGPVVLSGHSAGGHLVSRMACLDSPLPDAVRARLQHIVPLSGLYDLRPLLNTRMNQQWKMDEAEAQKESAALQRPLPELRVTCWVGADERPEFLRQNALLANIWSGLGARMQAHSEPGKHHFNVIADLQVADSELMNTMLG